SDVLDDINIKMAKTIKAIYCYIDINIVCGCGLSFPISPNLVIVNLCGHPDTPAIKFV
ncbi:hypothetical protein U3516DRAFT_768927, partial [Neocallimastix sp. 'constans']